MDIDSISVPSISKTIAFKNLASLSMLIDQYWIAVRVDDHETGRTLSGLIEVSAHRFETELSVEVLRSLKVFYAQTNG